MYEEVCEHIKADGIIVYPTDTLWGLGANPFSERAVLKIFELKEMQPGVVSVAFPDFGRAGEYAQLPWELAHVFPAPLTVIARAYSSWDYITLHGKMGVRIPDNETARNLLNECGPLTATSVNIHGGPNLSLDEIMDVFGDRVMIVEGEEPKYMQPSTIIDIVDRRVIRAGAYPTDRLGNLLSDRSGDGHLPGNDFLPGRGPP